MLDVEGLQKSYGKLRVLEGVDLHVAPGDVCGLIGPNGVGKTTLVSIVTGLRDADAGSVRVAGLDAAHSNKTNRKTIRAIAGCAPQELGLYPTISVGANMEFFGRWNGVTGRQLSTRSLPCVLGCAGHARHHPGRRGDAHGALHLHGTRVLRRPPYAPHGGAVQCPRGKGVGDMKQYVPLPLGRKLWQRLTSTVGNHTLWI